MADTPPVNPIRLRPIDHINFPLWDAEDHLGDDFEWLHAALGLRRTTYDELARWQAEFERLRLLASEVDNEQAWQAHARWGMGLRDQLADELAPRYSVEFDDNYR